MLVLFLLLLLIPVAPQCHVDRPSLLNSCGWGTGNPMKMATPSTASIQAAPANESVMTRQRSTKNLRHTELNSRDYTLNVNKTLAKKLEAAKRPTISYEFSSGGVCASFDITSFELFKEATHIYYNADPMIRRARCCTSTDKKKNIVQITYKIDAAITGTPNLSYTLNLYTTTCRVLGNGRKTDSFITTDLHKIHEIMLSATIDGKPIQLDVLNKQMTAQLTELISSLATCSLLTTISKPLSPSITPTRLPPANTKNDSISCIKCKRKCISRAVYCETGDHWIHYKCAGLTKENINLIELDNFVCKECVALTPMIHLSPNMSIASAILDDEAEEKGSLCNVCNKSCVNDDCDSCDTCLSVAHKHCLATNTAGTFCTLCLSFRQTLRRTPPPIPKTRVLSNQLYPRLTPRNHLISKHGKPS